MWSRRLDYTGVSVWLGALRSLASTKTRVTSGNAALISRSIRETAASTSGGAASVVEIEAERGQHLVRAEMHGQHLIGADDAWCHFGDALDFGAHLRVHCLAGEEALTFIPD